MTTLSQKHPNDIAHALAVTLVDGKRSAFTTELLADLPADWEKFIADVEAGRIGSAGDRIRGLITQHRGAA